MAIIYTSKIRIFPVLQTVLLSTICSLIVNGMVLPTISEAEMKIATVDVNKILNESKEGKAKRAQIDEMSEAAKKKIETKKTTLKAKEEKLKAAKATNESPEVKEFRTEAKEFATYVRDTEEEIRTEFLKVNKALTEKVMKQISDYAKEAGYDLVLDKSTQERSAVLFGNPSADITTKIINMLNE